MIKVENLAERMSPTTRAYDDVTHNKGNEYSDEFTQHALVLGGQAPESKA